MRVRAITEKKEKKRGSDRLGKIYSGIFVISINFKHHWDKSLIISKLKWTIGFFSGRVHTKWSLPTWNIWRRTRNFWRCCEGIFILLICSILNFKQKNELQKLLKISPEKRLQITGISYSLKKSPTEETGLARFIVIVSKASCGSFSIQKYF